MGDLFRIMAAGVVLAAWAAVTAPEVEAVPAAIPGKVFSQRLPLAGGAGPVSAVLPGEVAVVRPVAAYPWIARFAAAPRPEIVR